MIYEGVSFGFNISDGSTIVGHSFVKGVSIMSTIKTLNNFPHVWTIRIGHCILEKIFATFCLGLVDSLGSFTTCINPLLVILMDRSSEPILGADFGSHVWSHPRFRFLAGFRFSNVSSCGRDEDVIEACNSKR